MWILCKAPFSFFIKVSTRISFSLSLFSSYFASSSSLFWLFSFFLLRYFSLSFSLMFALSLLIMLLSLFTQPLFLFFFLFSAYFDFLILFSFYHFLQFSFYRFFLLLWFLIASSDNLQDISWIIPGKFIAFSGPISKRRLIRPGVSTLLPEGERSNQFYFCSQDFRYQLNTSDKRTRWMTHLRTLND